MQCIEWVRFMYGTKPSDSFFISMENDFIEYFAINGDQRIKCT